MIKKPFIPTVHKRKVPVAAYQSPLLTQASLGKNLKQTYRLPLLSQITPTKLVDKQQKQLPMKIDIQSEKTPSETGFSKNLPKVCVDFSFSDDSGSS